MEANKILSKQIFIEVLCGFLILGVIIIGGVAIWKNYKENKVVSKNDLVIDFQKDSVPSNLYSMSDGAGLKIKPYIYTFTNNSKKEITYKIVLRNKIVSKDIAKYLRVAIDDVTIKNLEEFNMENDSYILVEKNLLKGYTANHSIKIWLSNKSPDSLKGIKADFEFSLESE